jgi:hypothetical protein
MLFEAVLIGPIFFYLYYYSPHNFFLYKAHDKVMRAIRKGLHERGNAVLSSRLLPPNFNAQIYNNGREASKKQGVDFEYLSLAN